MAAAAILNFKTMLPFQYYLSDFHEILQVFYFIQWVIKKRGMLECKIKRAKMAAAAILNSSVNCNSVNY
jgi:hypothetical protein